MMRTGLGYDIHRLQAGEKLVLGGVEIPSEKGAIGHSDADTLIHAVIDALLGAAGLGDIGEHFPTDDESYRGISSLHLLRTVASLLAEDGWSVVNIDSIVILQSPQLADYKNVMKEKMANTLEIDGSRVNVKAKTKEGVDASGQGDAVEAHAVALLTRADSHDPAIQPAPDEETTWV